MRNDYQDDAGVVLDLNPGPIHGQGSARRTAGEYLRSIGKRDLLTAP